VTLCGVHHRAAHRGALVVEGVSAESVSFRHADGSPDGNPGDAQALDAHTKVFSALRQLGFRESEVRGVMDVLRQKVETRALDTQQLLRQALERLGPATRGR
jgi:Holliday junction resolvasome RuvABC DNA-binding subunit